MVLALQSTTLDINTNVESWAQNNEWIELAFGGDGYLGIGKHCRKWIPFGHAKVVLPSECSSLDRNFGKLVREIG